MKKDMIQCFTPHFSRLNENTQVIGDGRLTQKFIDYLRPHMVFELTIGRVQQAKIGSG